MYSRMFSSRLTFALFLLLFVFPLDEYRTLATQEARVLPVATSAERIQLLQDALGWMTFRKNGRLMTKEELAPLFFDKLKQHYISSKFYRTFVIAFEHGVLPKLTLNENDECHPGYTRQYKDPFNSSVTWHFQTKFTFNIYNNRWEEGWRDFCDYRQGLICKPATSKCECPEGSKMQPISQGNPVKRCLLEENEICALIDIDHGLDPEHTALADNLYQIIFNLEKPVSCKQGTQCRFKSPDITFSRCYNVNSGPWAPPYVDKHGNTFNNWDLDFGEECVLGLYASPGSCRRQQWYDDKVGIFKGFVCFNFGPPRSQVSKGAVNETRTGFCANHYGPYGIANGRSSVDYLPHFLPLFSPFVTPRTVPLRGRELEDFFNKYLGVYQYFYYSGDFDIHEEKEGARCSVKKTEVWEQSWSYFASLENDPPSGQDYVPQATKAGLYANLQPVIDMTKDTSTKICQIYQTFRRSGSSVDPESDYGHWEPSLKCVTEDPPDGNGNDGTCQKPGKLDTKAYEERFKKFQKHLQLSVQALDKQEDGYDRGILLEYPDGVCLPTFAPAPKARSLGEVLEGGFCAEGFVCYKDYSDSGNKYDRYCSIVGSGVSNYVCHASGDQVRYSRCEEYWQDKLLSQELEEMANYSILGRGEKCPYNIESSIRKKIGSDESFTTNKYKILNWLEKTRLSGGLDGGLCDHSKLLECKDTGICECFKNTQPRMVTVDGVVYYSDYCYVASGNCRVDPTLKFPQEGWGRTPLRLTELEKKRIWEYYGDPFDAHNCIDKNICVYLNITSAYYGDWECTTNNTGTTGYDLKPDPKPPTESTPTESSTPESGGNRPAGWHVSGGWILRMNKRLTGSLLVVYFVALMSY